MTEEQAKNLPKFTPSPVLKGLPEYLKDPINYYKIRKKLLDALAGQHSHSEMQNWANCLTCSNKMVNFRETVKKLGFISPAQFMAWQKTMDLIINPRRVPIRKYNS